MRTLTLIKILVVGLFLPLLAGCPMVTVAAYAGKDLHPDNKQIVGIFEVEGKVTENTSCKYMHRSDITRGRPFNDWGETYSHDIVACGFKFNIGKR